MVTILAMSVVSLVVPSCLCLPLQPAPLDTDCRFWTQTQTQTQHHRTVEVDSWSSRAVFYWWDAGSRACLPCRRCGGEEHTLQPCTKYRDTQCGSRHQMEELLRSLGIHVEDGEEDGEEYGEEEYGEEEGVRVYQSQGAGEEREEVWGERRLREQEEEEEGMDGTRMILQQRRGEEGGGREGGPVWQALLLQPGGEAGGGEGERGPAHPEHHEGVPHEERVGVTLEEGGPDAHQGAQEREEELQPQIQLQLKPQLQSQQYREQHHSSGGADLPSLPLQGHLGHRPPRALL